MTMIEQVARAICGNAVQGFCADVGGDLGCKRGRGESYNGTNCIATRDQLILTSHWDQARAAIEAMREPTTAMVAAVACYIMDNYDEPMSAVAPHAWRDAIDAALAEDPTSPADKTGVA